MLADRRLAIAGTTCAALVLVGSFLPWVRIGRRSRSSYALTSLLTRLELAPGGLAANALQWWPTLPLLLVISVVAVWAGRSRIGWGVGLAAGAYATAIAVTVTLAPVALEPGAGLSLGGAIGLVATGLIGLAADATAGVRKRRPTRRAAGGPASGLPDGRS